MNDEGRSKFVQQDTSKQVVGMKGGGHEASADGFFDMASFQQSHAEGMPAFKELRIQRDTLAIESYGLIEITQGIMANPRAPILDFLADVHERAWRRICALFRDAF